MNRTRRFGILFCLASVWYAVSSQAQTAMFSDGAQLLKYSSSVYVAAGASVASSSYSGNVAVSAISNPLFVSTNGGLVPANTNGLSEDVMTVSVLQASALANTGQTFVFVGNSGGIIDLTPGGASGFSLDAGQSISSFDNGNAIDDGSGSAISSNNVVALNTFAGATSVIDAHSGNHQVSHLSIFRGVTDTAAIIIRNAAAGPVTLTGLSVDNGSGTAILLDGNTENVSLLNVDLANLLGSLPNTGTALSITGASHPGQVTVGPGSDLGATTGTVIAANVADGLLHLDTSAAHITSANNTQNIVDVAGLAAGSTVLLGLITVDGATGDNVIKIGSTTGGYITLQDVLITNFGDQPTDTAIDIVGSGITVSFGELSVNTTSGNPLRIATE